MIIIWKADYEGQDLREDLKKLDQINAKIVEKVGGTFHIAIGASYPECYVEDPASERGKARCDEFFKEGLLNRSAQHVDIVTDFRPGGCGRGVWVDDVPLVVRDRVWTRGGKE